jgi:hypothetical protein
MLETLRRDYTYDPDTGVIYRQGKKTGARKGDRSYRRIEIRKSDPNYLTVICECLAHQVAWFLTYGEWTMQEIDHIDGNGDNNKLNNLRLATRSENQCNRKKGTAKTSSQYKGVYCNKNRWTASIVSQGKTKHLGSFSTELEAAQAYDIACKELHGEFGRPNFPT